MRQDMARPPAGLGVAGDEAAPATTARLRLGRELHDSLGFAIVVIGVQAGVADQALDRGEAGREQAREALGTIRTTSRQALEDLQATVATLRGGSGADGPVHGVGQLDALTSLAADAGLRVGLTVQGVARRLPPAVDLAAYRIVQEALTNVLRHAGPATATVRLRYDEHHLAVQVDDDGHRAAAGGRRLAATACSAWANGSPPSAAGWKLGRGPQAASACWPPWPGRHGVRVDKQRRACHPERSRLSGRSSVEVGQLPPAYQVPYIVALRRSHLLE